MAIPLHDGQSDEAVRNIVTSIAFEAWGKVPEIHVNGTGRYVTHGSVGDCGTTGRKLAVDFYGGNCEIGAGQHDAVQEGRKGAD